MGDAKERHSLFRFGAFAAATIRRPSSDFWAYSKREDSSFIAKNTGEGFEDCA
jgi:hypothetical protein